MRGDCIVPAKTLNVAKFYLLLLAMFILTAILNAKFLAETISKINTKQGVQYALLYCIVLYCIVLY